MAAFAISFGENSLRNGAKVNKNAAATAPTLVIRQPPGYYAVSITCEEVPYLHYMKVNMFSNGSRGSIVANYQGPPPDFPGQRHYTVKLWKQARRLTPPPSTPTNRTRFNLLTFAAKYVLLEIASVTFVI